MHISNPFMVDALSSALVRAPETEGAPAAVTPEAADPAPTASPDPAAEPSYDWLPETYRAEGQDPDFARFRQDYDDAQAQLSALSDGLPEDPSGYQIALPENMDFGDITPPDWFKFEMDAENPLVSELQGWMHQNRVAPEHGQQLVGLLAKYEAGRAAQYQAQADAEMKALGPQAQARIDRVIRGVQTRIPNEAQRQAVMNTLVSADAVRAVEVLLGGGAKPRAAPVTTPKTAIDPNASAFDRLIAARERA